MKTSVSLFLHCEATISSLVVGQYLEWYSVTHGEVVKSFHNKISNSFPNETLCNLFILNNIPLYMLKVNIFCSILRACEEKNYSFSGNAFTFIL